MSLGYKEFYIMAFFEIDALATRTREAINEMLTTKMELHETGEQIAEAHVEISDLFKQIEDKKDLIDQLEIKQRSLETKLDNTKEDLIMDQSDSIRANNSSMPTLTIDYMHRLIKKNGPRNKIDCLKDIRADTGCGLKEAKDFLEDFLTKLYNTCETEKLPTSY